MRLKTFAILIFSALLSCSIKTPEITLTGEKTALENQILGAYDQLTDNNLITTSKRTSANSGDAEKSRVVRQALQKQQLNKPEIDELKQEQIIGEGSRGYLRILTHEKTKNDPKYLAQVKAVVDEENNNRSIIYQRVLALNHKDSKAAKEAEKIFAKMQHEKSAPGTKIQQLNGNWIVKTVEE